MKPTPWTLAQLVAELARFHEAIEMLSKETPRDEDFWPAYADRANALEARCPIDLRDYARESILRTVYGVTGVRERVDLQRSGAR